MEERLFRNILRRYNNGEASEEEKRIVDAWYEAMGKNDPSFPFATDERASKKRYWSFISNYTGQAHEMPEARTHTSKRVSNILRYSLSIAASIVCLMLCYPLITDSDQPVIKKSIASQPQTIIQWTNLENPNDSPKQFSLPDGSSITLEPHSHLKYETSFDQTQRKVFLDGAAHFNVAHDARRPFLVHAREITTTVLGTSFSVKAFKGDKQIMVAVQTGRVSVSADSARLKERHESSAIILTPNQRIVYDRSEKTMLRDLVEQPQPIPAAEKIRRTRFEEAPVSEIFMALERVYGVTILFDKQRFSGCSLTTSITDGGIYNRLDIICQAIGARYATEDGQIMISGSGCD